MTDDYTTAEIVRSLQRIETSQASISARLDTLTSDFVTRGEHDKDIAAIESDVIELKAARAPWWAAASVLIGGGGVIVALISLYVR